VRERRGFGRRECLEARVLLLGRILAAHAAGAELVLQRRARDRASRNFDRGRLRFVVGPGAVIELAVARIRIRLLGVSNDQLAQERIVRRDRSLEIRER